MRPPGWEVAAGVFADATPRSVADCADAATLAQVRAWKVAQKAAQKDKQDRPLKPSGIELTRRKPICDTDRARVRPADPAVGWCLTSSEPGSTG